MSYNVYIINCMYTVGDEIINVELDKRLDDLGIRETFDGYSVNYHLEDLIRNDISQKIRVKYSVYMKVTNNFVEETIGRYKDRKEALKQKDYMNYIRCRIISNFSAADLNEYIRPLANDFTKQIKGE